MRPMGLFLLLTLFPCTLYPHTFNPLIHSSHSSMLSCSPLNPFSHFLLSFKLLTHSLVTLFFHPSHCHSLTPNAVSPLTLSLFSCSLHTLPHPTHITLSLPTLPLPTLSLPTVYLSPHYLSLLLSPSLTLSLSPLYIP